MNQVPVVHKLAEILGKDILPFLKTCKRGQEYMKDYYVLTSISNDPWSDACLLGNLEWVKYLHFTDHKGYEDNFDFAAANGYLEICKFLYEVGRGYSDFSMHIAATNGHIEVVKFLCSIGMSCRDSTIDFALLYRKYEVAICLVNYKGYARLNDFINRRSKINLGSRVPNQ